MNVLLLKTLSDTCELCKTQFPHFHSVLLSQRAPPPLKPFPSPTKNLLGKRTRKTVKEHALFNPIWAGLF